MSARPQDKGFKNVVTVTRTIRRQDAVSASSVLQGPCRRRGFTPSSTADYAAELAQIRSQKPDAVFFFLPGGIGINFVKQPVAAGLSRDTQLFAPGFSVDEDVIKRGRRADDGHAVQFVRTGRTTWITPKTSVSSPIFRKNMAVCPRSTPARLRCGTADGRAVRDVKGKVEDKAALQKALEAKHFKSVRGDFKFNSNYYPVQNYYLRVIGKMPASK